jgi:hypothetical protein
MKTYKFIVINKDNMRVLQHFSKTEDVISYVVYGSIKNFLIIKNENSIINPSIFDGIESTLVLASKLRESLHE